jgi:hypothetical protein
VWQQFYELKTQPYKGFKNTKWLRHFVFWYNRVCFLIHKSMTTHQSPNKLKGRFNLFGLYKTFIAIKASQNSKASIAMTE